ncbi:hypothetical protein FQN50_001954 [Emmonsiellopsis sp. PD_5]|nr:hypothetical protein FQN50_001954 [Emmonsiellopsis sp. PD_5]
MPERLEEDYFTVDGHPISEVLGLDGSDTAADASHSGTLGGPTAAANDSQAAPTNEASSSTVDESKSPSLGHQAAPTNEPSSSIADESNSPSLGHRAAPTNEPSSSTIDESNSASLGHQAAPTNEASSSTVNESKSPSLGHQAAPTDEASSSTIDESNPSMRGDQTTPGNEFNSSFLGGWIRTTNRYNQSLTRPSLSRHPANPTNDSINLNLGPMNQSQITGSARPQRNDREALIYTAGSSINYKGGCAFLLDSPRSLSCSFRLENTGPKWRRWKQHYKRAELRAVVAALVDFPQGWNDWNCVVIATDSTYVLDGVTDLADNGNSIHWVDTGDPPRFNKDLWELLFDRGRELSERHIKQDQIIIGPFHLAGVIGEDSPRYCRARHRFIERELKRRRPADSIDDMIDKYWDDPQENEDEEDSDPADEPDDEDLFYDPGLVTDESIQWTEIFYCLGYNPDVYGNNKIFVTGKAKELATQGSSCVSCEPSDDPNFARDETGFACYSFGSPGRPVAFPFHECCFEIMARVIGGSVDTRHIDKPAIYEAMLALCRKLWNNLALEYGDISGNQHFWESIPGDEYVVMHPTNNPGFKDILRRMVTEKTFVARSSTLDLNAKVRRDPLGKLPYDILWLLLSYLPGESVRSLILASWVVYSATRHPKFWKQLIHWDMPWFWELHEVVGDPRMSGLDYKSLYLWLDRETAPRYGMRGPFMAVANRRRIWSACEQLAKGYFIQLLREQTNGPDQDPNIAREISDASHMPMTKYPQPTEDVRVISKQFIQSWEEKIMATTLETYWNGDGYLAGLALTFGSERRGFGCTVTEGDIFRLLTFLDRHDWITGIILLIPAIDLLDGYAHTAVKGITVTFGALSSATIGDTGKKMMQRPFIVAEGQYLVGLVGETGADNIISRFGILESPRPSGMSIPGLLVFEKLRTLFFSTVSSSSITNPKLRTTQSLPTSQQLPWRPRTAQARLPCLLGCLSTPIWIHPHIRVLPPSRNYCENYPFPKDLIPHEGFVWARKDLEARRVRQISAYVAQDVTVDSSRPIECVMGLCVEYEHRWWEPKRCVGLFPGVWDQKDEDLPDGQVRHFEICGPLGEFVVGIDVAGGEFVKAIKIRTNLDREVCFGDASQQNWDTHRVKGEDIFVGLGVAFRPLGGYSDITGKGNRYIMSSVVPLTMTPEGPL